MKKGRKKTKTKTESSIEYIGMREREKGIW